MPLLKGFPVQNPLPIGVALQNNLCIYKIDIQDNDADDE